MIYSLGFSFVSVCEKVVLVCGGRCLGGAWSLRSAALRPRVCVTGGVADKLTDLAQIMLAKSVNVSLNSYSLAYNDAKATIKWALRLLQMQDSDGIGQGGGEGSGNSIDKRTPTPPRTPRGYYVTPPRPNPIFTAKAKLNRTLTRPHTIFTPKPKLIAPLKIAPRKFSDFFHIAKLIRTLKALS